MDKREFEKAHAKAGGVMRPILERYRDLCLGASMPNVGDRFGNWIVIRYAGDLPAVISAHFKYEHKRLAKLIPWYLLECQVCGNETYRSARYLNRLKSAKFCGVCHPRGRKYLGTRSPLNRPETDHGLWHLWVHRVIWPVTPYNRQLGDPVYEQKGRRWKATMRACAG